MTAPIAKSARFTAPMRAGHCAETAMRNLPPENGVTTLPPTCLKSPSGGGSLFTRRSHATDPRVFDLCGNCGRKVISTGYGWRCECGERNSGDIGLAPSETQIRAAKRALREKHLTEKR